MTTVDALSFEGARELADVIRVTPGWRVLEVLGERPSGPPRARYLRDVAGRRGSARPFAPYRNDVRIPATIHAIAPDGRRVNIGSYRRWIALLP